VTVELVRALCLCAGDRRRGKARRFLQGLSADELNYIAEFLGSCILESDHRLGSTRDQLAEDVARFERCRRESAPQRNGWRKASVTLQDNDHKMILLLEYLSRCNSQQSLARAANTGQT
jgi:hypothetical protein